MDTAALYHQYISELDRALNPVPSSIVVSDAPQVFLAEGVVPVAYMNDTFVIYRQCIDDIAPSHIWLRGVATVWLKIQGIQEAAARSNQIAAAKLLFSDEELQAVLADFPNIDFHPVLNLRRQLITAAGQEALFFITTSHVASESEEANQLSAQWRCVRAVESEIIAALAAVIKTVRGEGDALRFLRLCQTKAYQKTEVKA